MSAIDLARLNTNYLTLGDEKVITLTGKYSGDRLVIKNASGKKLFFKDGSIHSTHKEDALVFADDLKNCEILAEKFSLFFGGLTFWKPLDTVTVQGFNIQYAHTGIRATGDHVNINVNILDNRIQSASHEGIYMGSSKNTPNTSNVLRIENNVISHTGWDGIQVGNWRNTWIINNEITQAATVGEWGQWHAICINPGSQAWLWNNTIVDTAKHYIINKATAYMENPN